MVTVNLSENDLFEADAIDFDQVVNFVYGRNGTGKSTLTHLIEKQYSGQDEVQVLTFTGYLNILSDNHKLNAILLGNENVEAKAKIEDLEARLNNEKEELSKLQLLIDPNADDKNSIGWHLTQASREEVRCKNNLEQHLTAEARKIKNDERHIVPTTYNKNTLKNDLRHAKRLGVSDRNTQEKIIETKVLHAKSLSALSFDLRQRIDEVNSLIQKSVKKHSFIKELEDNPEKQVFAQTGLKLHKAGDHCAFCGSIIKEDRIQQLEDYFSADEIKSFQDLINKEIDLVGEDLAEVKRIDIDVNTFYPEFEETAKEVSKSMHDIVDEWKDVFTSLLDALDKKLKNLFSIQDELVIEVKSDLSSKISEYNVLVNENNSIDLKRQKDNAKKQLLYDRIQDIIENSQYKQLKDKLDEARKNRGFWSAKNAEITVEIQGLNSKIDEISKEIDRWKAKTRDEKILADKINKILKNRVNFELVLADSDNDGNGYYNVKDTATGEIRDIDKLSTGEHNFIALLYFIGKVEAAGDTNKKIVVFDDPVSSNDDYLQYVIIEELQHFIHKYIKSNDVCIIMTHNKHFYINIKYGYHYPSAKSNKKKASFIHLHSGVKTHIQYIEKQNDDFKTSYDALWQELKFIFDNCSDTTTDLMLNPIRRIIETFCKFNAISPENFYKETPGARKFFNVNSHSVDDLEAELNGETKEEIIALMKQCFENNNALNHFEKHWQSENASDSAKKVE